MLTKAELPECPVATTVQLVGSKWKLLIPRKLQQRPWRFNELKKSLEGISQKVLTDSLRSMEDDGIITRTVYPKVPGCRAGAGFWRDLKQYHAEINNGIISKTIVQSHFADQLQDCDTMAFHRS